MDTHTCPKGHNSIESDYCSECGAKIPAAAGAASQSSQPPHSPSLSGSVATEHCPACRAPREIAGLAFCEICGTHIFTEDRRLPAIIGIPAGIIVGGTLPEPAAHYFVDDKAAWHSICDAIPCFGGANGMMPRP